MKSERVVKVIHDVVGEDEVAFDPRLQRYYTGSRDQPGGAVLGVIDARSNSWIENIPTGVNGHSVAADSRSHLVFVPLTAPHPACSSGCVGVYRTK